MIRGFDISENNASGETGLLPEEIFDEAVKAGCRFVYVRSSWGNGHGGEAGEEGGKAE